MEKLMPYLQKAKALLDHLEKLVLLGALGALGYFAVTKMLNKNSMEQEISENVPTSRGEIKIGGDMLPPADVSSFHLSLEAATNTNKTPRVELLKGIDNHYLFSPEVWMTNQSHGLFRADDGERKRGIEAMSVARPPYSLNMHLWAEVRVNGNGNIVNRYITIRDEYLRYQTTNQVLFKDLFTLAPFMPTTNAVLVGVETAGKLTPGPLASLVPLRTDNEPYRNWLNWTNITQAGFVDKLHTNRFQRTWEIFPDRFVKQILKHPNPKALADFEEAWTGKVPDPTLYDQNSHSERLVVHFYDEKEDPNARQYYYKIKLYLHPATNVVHFGRERPPRRPPLPAYVLRQGQPEGTSVNFETGHIRSFRRIELVDLEYGHGTNHRILFPACKPGRKLYIDGVVFVVRNITSTEVVLIKDPQLTPADDPTRNRTYRLPISGPESVVARPGG